MDENPDRPTGTGAAGAPGSPDAGPAAAQYGQPPQGAPPQGAPPQGAPPQGAPPQGAPPYGTPPYWPGYGPPPYGGGGYGPGYGGYRTYPGPPWIIGRTADRVVGLLVGLALNWIGLIGTIVGMYLWAGRASSAPDEAVRRLHARDVSIWSGIGCFGGVVISLVLVVLLLVVFAAHVDGPFYPYSTLP